MGWSGYQGQSDPSSTDIRHKEITATPYTPPSCPGATPARQGPPQDRHAALQSCDTGRDAGFGVAVAPPATATETKKKEATTEALGTAVPAAAPTVWAVLLFLLHRKMRVPFLLLRTPPILGYGLHDDGHLRRADVERNGTGRCRGRPGERRRQRTVGLREKILL